MALNPEQMARLMSGMKIQQRAKVVGLPAPTTREEKRVLQYIDSQNTTKARAEAAAYATPATAGHITLGGAPKLLAESGLTADGFNFDDSQLAALKKLIHGRHVALIGAAGTGKTTMVKHALASIIYGGEGVESPIGVRQLPGDQGPSIAVCAFTGIASQVVKEMLPRWLAPACKTIHQLLEYKPVDQDSDRKGMFYPTRCATAKLDHDIIVIDEASMIGLDLWHNLVDALRPHTRIILIGDLNQLKPVADATMFAYALAAGIDEKEGWSLAELTTIHRQKELAANKIIDGAHAILNGQSPKFDDPTKDPDWRFIGYELPSQASAAHDKIIGAVNWLRTQPTPGSEDRALFDPYKDLILCAGNGYDENDSSAFIQQAPLNGTLSRIIEPPTEEHPVFIIDAGREVRRFAVGHRIMATKNESPDTKDRVTNGLTGRIVKIESNATWKGNKAMFGTEKEVMAWRTEHAKAQMAMGKSDSTGINLQEFSLSAVDTSKFSATTQNDEKQASHVITVRYVNGAERVYRTAADVSAIQLAYAVTVHKAQGSQADTVIIVVHHAVKKQLSREWLYTGVTRARRRVIVLYTRMGLSTAVARQQIFGANLREKVNRYREVMNNGNVMVRLRAREQMIEHEREV
jgi:exodeoxyribonuclease V alpha subunit